MPIDLEELEPGRRPAKPRDLTTLSIGELNEYIANLEAEIARAREAIKAKEAVRSGAEALFKR